MGDLKTVKDVVAKEKISINDFFSAMTLACNATAKEIEILDAKLIKSPQQIHVVGYAVGIGGQNSLQRLSIGEGTKVCCYIK